MQPGQILCPVMIQESTFSVTVNVNNTVGGGSGAAYSLQNNVCPRIDPIDSATSSCTVNINGQIFGNLNPSECMTALLAFNHPGDLDQSILSAYAMMLGLF